MRRRCYWPHTRVCSVNGRDVSRDVNCICAYLIRHVCKSDDLRCSAVGGVRTRGWRAKVDTFEVGKVDTARQVCAHGLYTSAYLLRK